MKKSEIIAAINSIPQKQLSAAINAIRLSNPINALAMNRANVTRHHIGTMDETVEVSFQSRATKMNMTVVLYEILDWVAAHDGNLDTVHAIDPDYTPVWWADFEADCAATAETEDPEDDQTEDNLTLEEAKRDVLAYLEMQDGAHRDAECIDELAAEHLKNVNGFGCDRDWSCRDVCGSVEPETEPTPEQRTMTRTEMRTARAALIDAHRFSGNVTPAGTVASLVESVGYEHAREIVALSVIAKGEWDGRISEASRVWAFELTGTTYGTLSAQCFYYPDDIHPAHMEQIARAMMEFQPEPTEFDPAGSEKPRELT